MTPLTEDEQAIIHSLTDQTACIEIVKGLDGQYYWFSGFGGWGEAEMHLVNTDQAIAIASLIARGVLEQTDKLLTGILMGNEPEWSSGWWISFN